MLFFVLNMSVAVSVGFTNVSSLAVEAFHLVYCFLSVLWFNHRCKDLGLVPRGLRLELKSPLNTQEAIQYSTSQ